MTGAPSPFSSSYAQARQRLLEATAAAGLVADALVHPLRGLQGEELALDVVRDGPADFPRLLIVSSACHGVEGFCGSGVQVAALRDAAWRAHAAAQGVAVLYLHALNPWGFAQMLRTTHENVDLNRNFHDFSRPLPVNTAYAELHPLLVPAQWPPSADNEQALLRYVAERGQAAFQAAVSGGQYAFADGMFFGGSAPCWSNGALREVLRTHARHATRIAWIDLHTGLGPSGLGERIFAGPDDAQAVRRARQWWDSGGRTPVTSIYDGSSTSAMLTGMMWMAVGEECPQAEYTGIAMEYGTVPVLETLQAVRAGNWLHGHPEAAPELAQRIRRQVLDAFYTDTAQWKQQVLDQAQESMLQAVRGLGR
ncbi:MAG TPA: M14 family metallopeptidase [Ramlibacter sp.]|nr:M14 family metallopeptidase [Ramlibacter sp.]